MTRPGRSTPAPPMLGKCGPRLDLRGLLAMVPVDFFGDRGYLVLGDIFNAHTYATPSGSRLMRRAGRRGHSGRSNGRHRRSVYGMNEPVGSTVMTDSSGNGLNGHRPERRSDRRRLRRRHRLHWVRRAPERTAVSPERVIQVPDNINLEPGNETFTIEIRYRTKEKFGNIIQKGQASTRRPVEDPEPAGHPVLPVHGLARPGCHRAQDAAEQQPMAQAHLRAAPRRR